MDAVRHFKFKEAARLEGKATASKRISADCSASASGGGSSCPMTPRMPAESWFRFVAEPSGVSGMVRAETCAALQNVKGQADAAPAESAPLLPFAAPSQKERTPVKAAPPAIPERYRPYIERCLLLVGDSPTAHGEDTSAIP